MTDIVPAAGLPTKSELSAAAYVANQIAGTEFVPAALRGKAPAVLAAVLTGRELGIGPMEALNKLHVIDGKVGVAPELMRALVLRAGHSIRTTVYTDEQVTLVGTRADNGDQAEVSWSMADAKRAGLAGKGAWSKYPRAMLLARATSELCRLLFPDVISGMSYTPEELGDDPQEQPQDAPESTVIDVVPVADVDVETGEIVSDAVLDGLRVGIRQAAKEEVDLPKPPALQTPNDDTARARAAAAKAVAALALLPDEVKGALQALYHVDSVDQLDAKKAWALSAALQHDEKAQAFMARAVEVKAAQQSWEDVEGAVGE